MPRRSSSRSTRARTRRVTSAISLIHDYFERWGRGPNVLTPSSAASSASKNSAIHREMSTDPEVAPRLGSKLASDAFRGRKSTSREGIAA